MSAGHKGIIVGANPEHKIDPSDGHGQPIAWIGRDHGAIERLSADNSPPRDGQRPHQEAQRPEVVPTTASRLRPMGLALLVLIVAGVSIAAWKIHAAAPAGMRPTLANAHAIPLVSVISPGVQPVTSDVRFTGAIAARYDMPIGIDGDAGRIVAIYVEAGDHVKQGQLLAKLDESVLVPQVNRLAAALEQAKAQAGLSAAEYRRALAVAPAGALSAEDVERRRATDVTDEANVKVVAAQLAEAEARLNRTRVVAPVEGTVLTRKAEVGQIASPAGEALFRIASGGEVEMRGQIAEQDLAVVRVGQPASVYLTGLPRAFAGHVRLLGAVIDPNTRLGEIRIALQPDPALRPGAFARGTVIVAQALRPVLPQTAVMSDSKGAYVFIVNSHSRVERRAVRVAGTIDTGIVVAAGLAGDEHIVTTAGGFLRDGEQVTVVTAGSGPAAATVPDSKS